MRTNLNKKILRLQFWFLRLSLRLLMSFNMSYTEVKSAEPFALHDRFHVKKSTPKYEALTNLKKSKKLEKTPFFRVIALIFIQIFLLFRNFKIFGSTCSSDRKEEINGTTFCCRLNYFQNAPFYIGYFWRTYIIRYYEV